MKINEEVFQEQSIVFLTIFRPFLRIFGSRPYPFKLFKGCLPQILLGLFLNTFSHFTYIFWRLYHTSTIRLLETLQKLSFLSKIEVKTPNSGITIICSIHRFSESERPGGAWGKKKTISIFTGLTVLTVIA